MILIQDSSYWQTQELSMHKWLWKTWLRWENKHKRSSRNSFETAAKQNMTNFTLKKTFWSGGYITVESHMIASLSRDDNTLFSHTRVNEGSCCCHCCCWECSVARSNLAKFTLEFAVQCKLCTKFGQTQSGKQRENIWKMFRLLTKTVSWQAKSICGHIMSESCAHHVWCGQGE